MLANECLSSCINANFLLLGTQGSEETDKTLREFGVYIANLFYMTSDTAAPIIKDVDLTDELSGTC